MPKEGLAGVMIVTVLDHTVIPIEVSRSQVGSLAKEDVRVDPL